MELQFHKTFIPYLRTIADQTQTQEQTQEVRLNDGMPDIGRVLASWGQVLIRGKEWRSGSVGVSGGVTVCVLYIPEDGTEPRCVETWLPFQMKWEIPDTDRDGTFCARPFLMGVDARSVSARKLMVRAGIGVHGIALVPSDAEVFTAPELPEDVKILKNTYPLMIPTEAGEMAFGLDENLLLPSSAPAASKIVRYALRPELMETKILSDKAIVRGVANLELLYRSEDGELHSWDFELPFSQYARLDNEYGSDSQIQIALVVTALELEKAEEENLRLKAGLSAQYTVSTRKVVDVVEDAYSPCRPVALQLSCLQVSSIIDTKTQVVHAEQMIHSDDAHILDAVFYRDPVQQFTEGDKVTAELSGVFQTLGRDPEGQLCSDTVRWQSDWSVPADKNANLEITVRHTGKSRVAMSGAGLQVQCDILLDVLTTTQQGISMVTGLELGQIQEPDPGRPSLILCKPGADSLWMLAKRTGSTVEAIKQANQLTDEPDEDRILLIPVI